MDDQPEVDRFSFPLLHTALLSPNQRELNSILRSTPCYCINERDAMGRTALFWAALRGDLEAVNQLLGHGADPSIADNRGSTPLLASVIESSEKVFRSLLDAGANIDARDHLGRTALMEAIRCREHDVDAFRECFEVGPEASFHANPASTGTGLQQRLQGYGRKIHGPSTIATPSCPQTAVAPSPSRNISLTAEPTIPSSTSTTVPSCTWQPTTQISRAYSFYAKRTSHF